MVARSPQHHHLRTRRPPPRHLRRTSHHPRPTSPISDSTTGTVSTSSVSSQAQNGACGLFSYQTPPSSASAYYPEANVLLSLDHHGPHAQTPSAKSIPIRLAASTGGDSSDRSANLVSAHPTLPPGRGPDGWFARCAVSDAGRFGRCGRSPLAYRSQGLASWSIRARVPG